MAKIVKVTMTRNQVGNKIVNTYPAGYDYKKIEILAYENLHDVTKVQCIGVVKAADLAAFTASPDIVELTDADAITLGDVWRPVVTTINDKSAIINILAKVKNSEALTQTELNAIDPDNAEPGVKRNKAFTTKLTEGKVRVDGR